MSTMLTRRMVTTVTMVMMGRVGGIRMMAAMGTRMRTGRRIW
jgi:hypothetical protein